MAKHDFATRGLVAEVELGAFASLGRHVIDS
jgi:hypothetical protein